jgi:Tat protein secretion system quality control protein TatD with DNase activity
VRSTETCGVVDTHCHLDLIMDRLGEPRESLGEWRTGLPAEQSFEACVTIGCSLATFDTTESFLHHDFVYGAFGIHPLSASDWTPEVEGRVEAYVKVGPAFTGYYRIHTRGV